MTIKHLAFLSKTKAWQLHVLSIFLLSGMSLSAQIADPRTTIQKFNAAFHLINIAYVDSVDQSKLIETAIIEMLEELDPHSTYISREEVERANEPLLGNFEGIGIQFQLFHDTIVVISPIPGGPSDKLGILAGDKIIRINEENSTGSQITNSWVLERLRGNKGTKVDVHIQRQGRKELMHFTIIRDRIPIHSIDATYMIDSNTGYIRLNRFSRTSMQEFQQSINQLRQQGLQNLILDLRNNSGGFLDIAVDLSDEFLDRNKLIVYTQGLRSPRQDFRSTALGNFQQGRLIILINEGSASASEIVAGAVQDWDRGLVMGRRSFGKGLVQRPFVLPDSSVIRLTTATYFTPSGRSIQKPYDQGIEAYHDEIQQRLAHGEMVYADSIQFPDTLQFLTSRNRIVYGGGGIMPDIFLPADTSAITPYYTQIWRKGIINSFVMNHLNANRRRLQKDYDDFEHFYHNFLVDEKLMEQFVSFAETEGVPRDPEGLAISGNYIAVLLKAFLARNLFDLNAYYRIVSKIDPELQQAIKTIKQEETFKDILGFK
ncbi:MAG TPA: S41 family peptidase [Bacteroidales bacterium]|nr:S41 family peptidase [Bacteroidales bacterium]